MAAATSMRTICYIDGFNLYYGLKSASWQKYYWLNMREMATKLVRPPFMLVGTKYFTARISGAHPGDSPQRAAEREASRRRQSTYIEALETLKFLDVIEGQFLMKREFCRACNSDYYRAEEKMTDVRIATELITDAFLDRFDSALVVSGDSDLVPPVDAVKTHFPHKRIVAVFPPKRHSMGLQAACDSSITLWESTLRDSQFSDKVLKADGTQLKRPSEWR